MHNVRTTNLPHNLTPNLAAPTVALTIADTSVNLAAVGFVLHDATQYVLVSVETAGARCCPEGTTATSSLGHTLAVGTMVLLSRAEATSSRWIRSSSVSAILQASQYTN